MIIRIQQTKEQKIAFYKRYAVRRNKLKDILKFWTKRNITYSVEKSKIKVEAMKEFIQSSLLEKNLRHSKRNEIEEAECKESIAKVKAIEQSVINDVSLSWSELNRSGIEATEFASARLVNINRCGKLLLDKTGDYLCRLCPDLFPFGEGHPNAKRQVKVSFQQCCAPYLQLSSKTFSNHFYSI